VLTPCNNITRIDSARVTIIAVNIGKHTSTIGRSARVVSTSVIIVANNRVGGDTRAIDRIATQRETEVGYFRGAVDVFVNEWIDTCSAILNRSRNTTNGRITSFRSTIILIIASNLDVNTTGLGVTAINGAVVVIITSFGDIDNYATRYYIASISGTGIVIIAENGLIDATSGIVARV
jgi:hypothetical protein